MDLTKNSQGASNPCGTCAEAVRLGEVFRPRMKGQEHCMSCALTVFVSLTDKGFHEIILAFLPKYLP